ncbi:MAG: hypothetical protein KDK89_07285 [Alphaproteobacteria bacterium]|nr:hypothetical protein [Alphaproteobacteria bacterium]
MNREPESREDQARRNLQRVEREREKLFHDGQVDGGNDDPIEKLGKRIARILGPLLALGLAIYLFATYLT